jgi:hypothetical protein
MDGWMDGWMGGWGFFLLFFIFAITLLWSECVKTVLDFVLVLAD